MYTYPEQANKQCREGGRAHQWRCSAPQSREQLGRTSATRNGIANLAPIPSPLEMSPPLSQAFSHSPHRTAPNSEDTLLREARTNLFPFTTSLAHRRTGVTEPGRRAGSAQTGAGCIAGARSLTWLGVCAGVAMGLVGVHVYLCLCSTCVRRLWVGVGHLDGRWMYVSPS